MNTANIYTYVKHPWNRSVVAAITGAAWILTLGTGCSAHETRAVVHLSYPPDSEQKCLLESGLKINVLSYVHFARRPT